MFQVAYTLLIVVVITETMILHALVTEALRLRPGIPARSESIPPSEPLQHLLGTQMPTFSARLLDDEKEFTDRELRGKASLLCFISPSEVGSMAEGAFNSMLYGLWAQIDTPLFLVCSAPDCGCRALLEAYDLKGIYGEQIAVVVDDEDHLRKLFGVTAGPCAVLFDESSDVKKVGRPTAQSDAYTGLLQKTIPSV